MSLDTSARLLIITVCILLITFLSCAAPANQTASKNINYDPGKKYAAFAVKDSPASAEILSTAKQQSIVDGFEIGPIEYYTDQNQDFDPVVKKLIASKQVTLIWVVGDLMALPAVRKSASKLGYSGGFRLMTVTGQALPSQ